MSTVPKIQNRVWTPQILPHITEKKDAEWRKTFKDFATLLAMVGLLAWVYWVF